MPRISKSKTLAEVPVESSAPAPVVAKSKAKAKVEVKATDDSNVVVAPVVGDSDAATTVAEVVDIESSIAAQSVEFLAKLNQLSVVVSSLKNEYRLLEKKWSRELKAAQKINSKRKRKSGNRAPSGFVKPTRISDELAKFLQKPSGTEMARTDVTREINTYIRSHNLQDKENGRKINPDSKLSSLLKLKKTDELTYFNLQKYMSPHFEKAVKAVAPVADVVAPVAV